MATYYTYTFGQPVRAFFLNVFEPKSFMKNGKAVGDPKYSVNLGIPVNSPELAPMKAKMAEAARSKWPTRNLSELHWPISSGESKMEKAAAKDKDGSFFAGHVILDARTKKAPALAVLQNGKIIELTSDALKAQWKSKFYNGCFVGVSVNFVPYEGEMGADGVTAYLQSVLWVKDGERIGGVSTADVFKHYVGTVSDQNPLGDDEIPY